ncbi:MAG: hypothetical protein IT429_12400 [Gemmataceae bacterium]|nr:hypothetical protein [Gemmataceae bacterium]
MNDQRPTRFPAWALVLAVFLLATPPCPAPAAGAAQALGPAPAAAPAVRAAVPVGWNAILADKERLIQVAAVIAAIAIFLLTRSTK